MPALAIIHQQGLTCATCGALVAKPGSQSVVTTKDGAIILFADTDPPAQLALAIVCEKGHQTKPPPSVRIEMAGSSPSAPEAANAVALNGTLRSGKKLTF